VGNMSDVQLLAEIARGDEGLAKLGLKRAPVVIEQEPPQAGVLAPASPPNPLGTTAANAQDIRQGENVGEAPRPAAEGEG